MKFAWTAKGSPFGGAAEQSEAERASPLKITPQPALWTFRAIYDFSVKKTAAGLIFLPFSCKLKNNHARVFSGREKLAKHATHGIKTAKNNGA